MHRDRRADGGRRREAAEASEPRCPARRRCGAVRCDGGGFLSCTAASARRAGGWLDGPRWQPQPWRWRRPRSAPSRQACGRTDGPPVGRPAASRFLSPPLSGAPLHGRLSAPRASEPAATATAESATRPRRSPARPHSPSPLHSSPGTPHTRPAIRPPTHVPHCTWTADAGRSSLALAVCAPCIRRAGCVSRTALRVSSAPLPSSSCPPSSRTGIFPAPASTPEEPAQGGNAAVAGGGPASICRLPKSFGPVRPSVRATASSDSPASPGKRKPPPVRPAASSLGIHLPAHLRLQLSPPQRPTCDSSAPLPRQTQPTPAAAAVADGVTYTRAQRTYAHTHARHPTLQPAREGRLRVARQTALNPSGIAVPTRAGPDCAAYRHPANADFTSHAAGETDRDGERATGSEGACPPGTIRRASPKKGWGI